MSRFSISFVNGRELLAIKQAVYQGLLALYESAEFKTQMPIRLACVVSPKCLGFVFDFPTSFTTESPRQVNRCDFWIDAVEGVAPMTLAEIVVCELASHLISSHGLRILYYELSEIMAVWWFRAEEGADFGQRAKLLARSIEELELSIRAYYCLRNANIRTIGELVGKTEAEMLKSKNFGRKSLGEIKDTLTALGLRLGMSEADKATFPMPED